MYLASYHIQPQVIDYLTGEITAPFLDCYYIHSAFLKINGLPSSLEEHDVKGRVIKVLADFPIDNDDELIIHINYFYMKPDNIDVLGHLVDGTYSDPMVSKTIMSQHYTTGQFSLDNGLYKNAVMNFGTTLEAVLNKRLDSTSFDQLIEKYTGAADKTAMHEIRLLRNKVHPNRIRLAKDVTRDEAIKARNALESILGVI